MSQPVEIRILKNRSGRQGFLRSKGERCWRSIPVRQAEKALKEGVVDYGVHTKIPVISWKPTAA